jgi:hypothetical protein
MSASNKLLYARNVRAAILKANPAIAYIVDQIPAADAVEVVHSGWKLNKDGSGTCLNCNRTTIAAWDYDSCMRYCPSCGAKMEEHLNVCN